jgi:hypothetical protein
MSIKSRLARLETADRKANDGRCPFCPVAQIRVYEVTEEQAQDPAIVPPVEPCPHCGREPSDINTVVVIRHGPGSARLTG